MPLQFASNDPPTVSATTQTPSCDGAVHSPSASGSSGSADGLYTGPVSSATALTAIFAPRSVNIYVTQNPEKLRFIHDGYTRMTRDVLNFVLILVFFS